jgi:hypothetical protein
MVIVPIKNKLEVARLQIQIRQQVDEKICEHSVQVLSARAAQGDSGNGVIAKDGHAVGMDASAST